MPRARVWQAAACVCAATFLSASGAATAAPPERFDTAVYTYGETVGAQAETAFAHLRATGATFLRINMWWSEVAPTEPLTVARAANPAEPAYRWDAYDRQISAVVSHGFEPYLTIVGAPGWAQQAPPAGGGNSNQPDAVAYAAFASAVAKRYSGNFDGLPRIRFFQAWNEPNLSIYLVPQLVGGQPFAPQLYRRMLNGFADAVHAVHPDNVVVAGGLAPFRDVFMLDQDKDWGPLSFMRALLCLSPSLVPTCGDRVKFDVWAQHPYTSGGPTHHAVLANDVSLGDLPKVTRVLAAAVAAHHIVASHPVGFWVTEFSWDSKPPDPYGVPMALEQRWVSEALYRMWLNGVSLVTWLMLTDSPLSTSAYQSGLYFDGDGQGPATPANLADDKPKPLLEAFRFPFVAFPRAGGNAYWGRTPAGRRATVALEQSVGSRWKTVSTVRTNSFGIFQGTVRAGPRGLMRARIVGAGERSIPFSLARVPDRPFNPFGETALEPPKPR